MKMCGGTMLVNGDLHICVRDEGHGESVKDPPRHCCGHGVTWTGQDDIRFPLC